MSRQAGLGPFFDWRNSVSDRLHRLAAMKSGLSEIESEAALAVIDLVSDEEILAADFKLEDGGKKMKIINLDVPCFWVDDAIKLLMSKARKFGFIDD